MSSLSVAALSPRRLFRIVAVSEAVTWAGLLGAMGIKYGSDASHLGEQAVSIFGMLHGVVFIAYCLVTIVLWSDQGWPVGRLVLGLVSAVPPFMTLWFETYAVRRELVGLTWRSRSDSPNARQRLIGRALARPGVAVAIFVSVVAVLTVVALLLGP